MLKCEELSKQFVRNIKGSDSNVITAVKKTNLEFTGGEIVAIKGRSGSGKSTLLNMLSGLLCPTAGKVYFETSDIYSMNDDERSHFINSRFGYIPQSSGGIYSLNMIENILLPSYLFKGDSKKVDNGFLDELIEFFELKDLTNAFPGELSGGELRRMAVIRAILGHPDVIFADEPTGDLDPDNTDRVFEVFRREAERGAGVIIVSHDEEVEKYADKVYTMSNGILKV